MSNNLPGSSQNLQSQHDAFDHKIQGSPEQYDLSVGDFASATPASVQLSHPSGLEAIFARKQDQNDFDTLLISDLSRLTRSSARHGMHFLKRFIDAGITVLVAGDPHPVTTESFTAFAIAGNTHNTKSEHFQQKENEDANRRKVRGDESDRADPIVT